MADGTSVRLMTVSADGNAAYSAVMGSVPCVGPAPYEAWVGAFDAAAAPETQASGGAPGASWTCIVNTLNGRFRSIGETQYPVARSLLYGLPHARRPSKGPEPKAASPQETAPPAPSIYESTISGFAVQPFASLEAVKEFRAALADRCAGNYTADLWKRRAQEMAEASGLQVIDLMDLTPADRGHV